MFHPRSSQPLPASWVGRCECKLLKQKSWSPYSASLSVAACNCKMSDSDISLGISQIAQLLMDLTKPRFDSP